MSALPRNFFDDFSAYAGDAVGTLEGRLGGLCQSPIEVAFAAAFILALRLHGYPVSIFADGTYTLEGHPELSGFIAPQSPVLNYKADFVVGIRLGDGFTCQMVVECDGHDFHNITKEQVSRDRRRDREMQQAGWRVFRFTGSDIHRSAFTCANDVIMALLRMAGESEAR